MCIVFLVIVFNQSIHCIVLFFIKKNQSDWSNKFMKIRNSEFVESCGIKHFNHEHLPQKFSFEKDFTSQGAFFLLEMLTTWHDSTNSELRILSNCEFNLMTIFFLGNFGFQKKLTCIIETWQIEIKTFLIRKIILGHEVLRAESNKLSCHVIGPVWLG